MDRVRPYLTGRPSPPLSAIFLPCGRSVIREGSIEVGHGFKCGLSRRAGEEAGNNNRGLKGALQSGGGVNSDARARTYRLDRSLEHV
jgi:hypothetical protein